MQRSRRWSLAILQPILLAAVMFGCSGAEQAPQYDVHIDRNVMVPMRDGVRLGTDIYRPARNGQPVEGKFPVVYFHIPYDKTAAGTQREAEFYARNGYVYVAQDVRGRYASEGIFNPFSAELAPDGYDAVVWASKQPWSTGKVATLGTSYGGLTQLNVGVANPPGLVGQVVTYMGDNFGKTGIYTDGAYNMRRISWIVNQAVLSQEAQKDPKIKAALQQMEKDMLPWINRFPLGFKPGASPLSLVPNYERFLSDGIGHWKYDEYWQNNSGLNIEQYWDSYADVPVYWQGGWYDIYTARTPIEFNALRTRKKSPQKMIIGAWCHCRTDTTAVGDIEFGPAASINADSMRLRFYDQYLKGIETGMLKEPPIRLFVMGGGDGHKTPEGRIYHGGEWRWEGEWPLARTNFTTYYFQPGGGLRTSAPTGSAAPRVFVSDPKQPVPTVGGQGAFQGSWGDYKRVEKGSGGFDQRDKNGRPLRLRPDVIVFQTDPLTEDTEITGPIEVKLFASSSAVNTDFTAKLIDVYPSSADWPEGFEMNFQDGIIRASHRESLSDPTPLEPGKIYEFTIEIPPVANLFRKGHRIRVDISSSNYPRFDLNSGTMDPPFERRRFLPQENRIYHDATHPSHVVLPLVPRRATSP